MANGRFSSVKPKRTRDRRVEARKETKYINVFEIKTGIGPSIVPWGAPEGPNEALEVIWVAGKERY